jgi:hypothetical protein
MIEQNGRFSCTWRGCLGVYGHNKGAAELTDGHLILKPEEPNEKLGFGTATDFVPVRWEGRLTLVSNDQMKFFCNAVNQGAEPRDNIHGFFYVKTDDFQKKVSGVPRVPKDWDRFILKKPLHARVIKVLEGGRAKIDHGAESGA